jgi:cation diffusion facilitator family transporter
MNDPGVRANAVSLLVNVALAVAKLGIGTVAGSAALVADGFNSAGDVLATGIGLLGYQFGRLPPDDNHPFGHGNAESVAGLTIGGILLATGVFVAIDGARALVAGPGLPPEPLAAGVALATAALKEALYRYTTRVGTRLNSPALLATAADHRADVFIALAVAAGIGGAGFGLPWLDPLAAVGVGFWIVHLAREPIQKNFGVLMDASSPEVTAAVRSATEQVPGVVRVDDVLVHPLGPYHVVNLEIAVDASLTVREAHTLAHAVEDHVRKHVPHIQKVQVHVNPA